MAWQIFGEEHTAAISRKNIQYIMCEAVQWRLYVCVYVCVCPYKNGKLMIAVILYKYLSWRILELNVGDI